MSHMCITHVNASYHTLCDSVRMGAVESSCAIVLQCVALCCSVLQCVAVCCSVRMDAVESSCAIVLQCVALCCSVLQCVAVCIWALSRAHAPSVSHSA